MMGLGLSLMATRAQTPEDVIGRIEQAIKQSDAQALSGYFRQVVEVKLLDGRENEYSPSQAQVVLRDFFQQNPATRGFAFKHRGSSGNGEIYYAMGLYESSKGSYDTNVLVKKADAGFYIQHIRFEKHQP